MYCAEERDGSFVISCCNSTVLFEFCKEILNQVAAFVEFLVIVALVNPVRFRRYHRLFSGPPQGLKHPFIGIIGLVGENNISLDLFKQLIRAIQITVLAGGQMKSQRIAQSIAGGMDFGAQSAF